jgi:hypothetical protein
MVSPAATPHDETLDEEHDQREDMMFDEYTTSFGRNFRWVKSESGNTYLCPAGEDLRHATEDVLQSRCIDESSNPQNN